MKAHVYRYLTDKAVQQLHSILPEHSAQSLIRYIEHGDIELGDFMTALVENDLRRSMLRADPTMAEALPALVLWMYHEAPAMCWGSRAAMLNWRSHFASEQGESNALEHAEH